MRSSERTIKRLGEIIAGDEAVSEDPGRLVITYSVVDERIGDRALVEKVVGGIGTVIAADAVLVGLITEVAAAVTLQAAVRLADSAAVKVTFTPDALLVGAMLLHACVLRDHVTPPFLLSFLTVAVKASVDDVPVTLAGSEAVVGNTATERVDPVAACVASVTLAKRNAAFGVTVTASAACRAFASMADGDIWVCPTAKPLVTSMKAIAKAAEKRREMQSSILNSKLK